jgi:GMP synthase-like glutamine amidotransferase
MDLLFDLIFARITFAKIILMIGWVLEHVPYETPQRLGTELRRRGYTLTFTRLYTDDPFPSPQDLDLLVIMGGPMGTYEEDLYPWLKEEKRFIREVIATGKKILGICLGAQLLAECLGGKVYPHTCREIGWYPVELTPEGRRSQPFAHFPERFFVFHWHGDTYDLPPHCFHLARSEACTQQAFVTEDGRIVGLQFHLEMTEEGISSALYYSGELGEGNFIQQKDEILSLSSKFTKENERYLNLFLDNFIADGGGV